MTSEAASHAAAVARRSNTSLTQQMQTSISELEASIVRLLLEREQARNLAAAALSLTMLTTSEQATFIRWVETGMPHDG